MKLNTMKYKYIASIALILVSFSCSDLTVLNENPNGIEAKQVNPNLILPTVLTEASKSFLNLGFGDIAGVVQHIQKDAFWGSVNDYQWSDQSWAGYYGILVNNKLLYDRSVELDMQFHQGVSLVIRAMMFALITDLWGDAPYSKALNGDLSGLENTLPAYDNQEDIYMGIIADLKKANDLLSKNAEEYIGLGDGTDLIYNNDPTKWRKMANSLLLRYYMRISPKLPDVAQIGMEEIMADQSKYPIITSSDDDATMGFAGNTPGDSWPNNTVSDPSTSNYRRIRMCETFVDRLQTLNDPRLAVWANKVEIPLVIDAGLPSGTDTIIAEIRYLSPDKVDGIPYNDDPEYVGLPVGINLPAGYNINDGADQTGGNRNVSLLNPIYREPSGDLLKVRLISASEVHFTLAEAALKGWIVGDAQQHYKEAINASFETWGISDEYATYIGQSEVSYAGTLDQILEQKWIASWTATTEAWFDYRRTGLPAFQPGPHARRPALPIRFYYMRDEINLNADNTNAAINKLDENNAYTQEDGKNSAWSKSWLIQGTGKPW